MIIKGTHTHTHSCLGDIFVPSSCGSSWQSTANDVAKPDFHDSENAAPRANPSAKLWIPSPMVIM